MNCLDDEMRPRWRRVAIAILLVLSQLRTESLPRR
ncbi:hypothetical protein Rrhod_4363 [Rhodococcus rhodnii LMG 5362]|uniref:Uncharacterized protein n=1 Tax=Rhodococcus rhodnii LMG 5362 TaxID=1273125 RepID=R7WGP3_9NOCA|nr:hypothetical protein Rrhod_4363 [Rhodococcus rhodnii LMG 5362]